MGNNNTKLYNDKEDEIVNLPEGIIKVITSDKINLIGKFRADICVGYPHRVYGFILGYYDTVEEAQQAQTIALENIHTARLNHYRSIIGCIHYPI